MKIGSIWLGCKVTLALVVVLSLVAPMALGQQQIQITMVSGSNFQLYGSWTVTRIEVSHSYGGQQGWIKLIDANGNEYGPWTADTSSSIWRVYMNRYLLAGSYRLVDSDPGSYQGTAWIYGNT